MSFTNQTTTIRRAPLCGIAFVAGVATVLGLTGAASASVATLSGGDPGEGYSPLHTVIYAYNTGPATGETAQTVQGVTFLAWSFGTASPPSSPANPAGIPNTSITVAGNGAFGPTVGGSLGASANDVALENLLTGGFFSNGLTLTLGGLTTGNDYQVDIFVRTVGDERTENFTFTGATTPTDFFTTSGTGTNAYDVSETLAPDVSGNIVVTLPGGTNPFINAFSVTYAPEPASLGLIAAGGLLLLRRRRAVR